MKKQIRGLMIIAVPGIMLLSAWLWTDRQGISREDRQIYEEAASLQKQVDTLGFRGFRLLDYPVAVYDGRSDYVFYEGEVRKRAPVLETFAGTAYPVEDHFEVLVPALAQFDRLMSLAGGVEGMVAGSGYGPKNQIATIWHEAFHAYQMTDFAVLGEKVTPKDMRRELAGQAQEGTEEGRGEKTEEEWIVEEVDKKEDIQIRLRREMELLKEAARLLRADISDIDELRTIVLEYSECHRQRMEEMPEEARDAEIRCELTEGTAYYVEAEVCRMVSGEQAYEEHYLDSLDMYEGGRGKYYRIGFAKCLILDRLAPDWKETLDFSMGLDEMVEEYLGSYPQ